MSQVMSVSKHILIVEDEMMIALHIQDTLEGLGYRVSTATSTIVGLRFLDASAVDLAIVDYKVSDGTTDVLMERLQAAGIPFIICSGLSEPAHESAFPRAFLPKPFTSDSLIDAVSAMIGIER